LTDAFTTVSICSADIDVAQPVASSNSDAGNLWILPVVNLATSLLLLLLLLALLLLQLQG